MKTTLEKNRESPVLIWNQDFDEKYTGKIASVLCLSGTNILMKNTLEKIRERPVLIWNKDFDEK